MNATMWATLTDFCKYLGREGLAKVEETERGWFISYIERDVAKQQRDEALARRKVAEAEAEKLLADQLEHQRVAAARELDKLGASISTEGGKLVRRENDQPIQVAISSADPAATKKRKIVNAFAHDTDDTESDGDEIKGKDSRRSSPPVLIGGKKSTKKTKVSKSRVSSSSWLYNGIIVRVIAKSLKEYFRRKAVVTSVEGHVATVSMIDSGDVLQLDEDDLDTVIPKRDQAALIVRGNYRGQNATVIELNSRKCYGELKLVPNRKSGKEPVVVRLDYADFCKVK